MNSFMNAELHARASGSTPSSAEDRPATLLSGGTASGTAGSFEPLVEEVGGLIKELDDETLTERLGAFGPSGVQGRGPAAEFDDDPVVELRRTCGSGVPILGKTSFMSTRGHSPETAMIFNS
mmetsp:Transcript_26492/g.75852  ORF Transcript_26492/g.75852 Transcript_26492/m.75852 type:complete len:122 (+) Transcript_26492:121-486(+)